MRLFTIECLPLISFIGTVLFSLLLIQDTKSPVIKNVMHALKRLQKFILINEIHVQCRNTQTGLLIKLKSINTPKSSLFGQLLYKMFIITLTTILPNM